MNKIFKYELEITDTQSINLGYFYAIPLSVIEQRGRLRLYAIVPQELPYDKSTKYEIAVDIIGTGNPFNTSKKFIGTVAMSNSGFVWHVFAECKEVRES